MPVIRKDDGRGTFNTSRNSSHSSAATMCCSYRNGDGPNNATQAPCSTFRIVRSFDLLALETTAAANVIQQPIDSGCHTLAARFPPCGFPLRCFPMIEYEWMVYCCVDVEIACNRGCHVVENGIHYVRRQREDVVRGQSNVFQSKRMVYSSARDNGGRARRPPFVVSLPAIVRLPATKRHENLRNRHVSG